MATLVLGTVGRIFLGPIGGMVGTVLGQAIDGRLFHGAAREGPRLTELAVQTSSYGTPIPRLFGTIRVAGTVIWSTDLIETRTTSGGKGQPETNSYSYSASFAVLLSARPIRGVRRIWAEGKLLRGAAGDWKSQTGFRLHPGDEDQAVDPLIASALGATPAYRGMAYAVFEDMQLADYGNRIPSLTFEVEADNGPIDTGRIVTEMAGEVTATGGLTVCGFAASGANVRGVLHTLVMLDGGWWRTDGARLERRIDPGTPRVLTDVGMTAQEHGGRRRRSVAALAATPREIAVAHYDPARDYQIGVQRVRRPGPGEQIDRVELPAVLEAGCAKGVAAAIMQRHEAERTRRRVALGVEGLAIAPGDIVTVSGEAGRWRVARSDISGVLTTLELVPLPPASAPARASSGHVVAAADVVAGRTRLIAAELAGGDTPLTMPRINVIAAGEGIGWRQAALLYSLDDGATWMAAGQTAAPGVIGRVDLLPDAASAHLEDRRSRMIVRLLRADMALGDADAAALGVGRNVALVGNELIQFERADPLGQGRWALTGLRRGLRGTEASIGTQRIGDRFALIEPDAMATIDVPVAAIGRTLRVMASGVGDAEPATVTLTLSGASVAPPAPVHVTANVQSDGSLAIGWTRRSRAGWSWTDGNDVPLGEEAECYRVTFDTPDGTRRTMDTQDPALTLPTGTWSQGRMDVAVVQQGTLASSPPTRIMLDNGVTL